MKLYIYLNDEIYEHIENDFIYIEMIIAATRFAHYCEQS